MLFLDSYHILYDIESIFKDVLFFSKKTFFLLFFFYIIRSIVLCIKFTCIHILINNNQKTHSSFNLNPLKILKS